MMKNSKIYTRKHWTTFKVGKVFCALFICLLLTACPFPETTMSDGDAEGNSGGDVDKQATSVCKPLGMTSPYKLEKGFACNPGDTPQTLGLISYIHAYMDCKLTRTSREIFTRIATKPWYGPTLAAAATLTIAIYSSTLLLGIVRFTPYDVVANLMRIGAVFFLATNWGNFSTYVRDFFEGAVNSLSAGLAGALSSGLTGMQFMDQIIGDIVSYNTLKIILALAGTGGNGWLYGLLMIVLVISYMWGLFTAVYIVLISLVGRNLLYALAPLFLVFLLFNQTRDMFSGWLKQITSFTLKPIMIFAVLGFLKSMYDDYMMRLITPTNICYKQFWPMPGDIIQLNWWQFGTDAVSIEGPNAQVPFSFAVFVVLIMIAWIMRYMFSWADRLGADLAVVTSKGAGTLIGLATAKAAASGVAGVALGGVSGAMFGKGGQGGILSRLSGNSGATGGIWNVNNLKIMRNAIRGNPLEVAAKIATSPFSIAGNVLYGATGNMAAKAGQGVKSTLGTAAADIFGVDKDTAQKLNQMRSPIFVSPATPREANLAKIAGKQKDEMSALQKKVDATFDTLRKDTQARKALAAGAGIKKSQAHMEKQTEIALKSVLKGSSMQRAAITNLLTKQQDKILKLSGEANKEIEKYSKLREGVLRKGVGELRDAQDKKLEELVSKEKKQREQLSKQQQDRRKVSTLSKTELAKKESEELQKLNAELKVERSRFETASKSEEENLRSAHSKITAEGMKEIVSQQEIKKKEITKEFDKELDALIEVADRDGVLESGMTQERLSAVILEARDEESREENKEQAKQEHDIERNVFDADRRVVEVAKQEHQLKKEQTKAHKKELTDAGATQKEIEKFIKKAQEDSDKELGAIRAVTTGSEKETSSWLFGDGSGKSKDDDKKPAKKDEAPPVPESYVDPEQSRKDEAQREQERKAREDAEEERRRRKKQEEEEEELRRALEEQVKLTGESTPKKPKSDG
jgi:hypothetical protein